MLTQTAWVRPSDLLKHRKILGTPLDVETDPSELNADDFRLLVSFAEAIVPGSHTVIGADERTAELTENIVREVSPLVAKGWFALLRFLDRAAVLFAGKRFSSLDAQAQQHLLRRWGTHPTMAMPLGAIAFPIKFAHFDRPPVYRSLGGEYNVVEQLEEPRWLSQIYRGGRMARRRTDRVRSGGRGDRRRRRSRRQRAGRPRLRSRIRRGRQPLSTRFIHG